MNVYAIMASVLYGLKQGGDTDIIVLDHEMLKKRFDERRDEEIE